MAKSARRRMGVEERREQLITVALDLFASRSPEDVSIDEIAERAGISRPLVYHYFPGKQSLYEAALRRAGGELSARFVEPREGPLGDRLLRVMGRFFDFVEDHGPGFSALMRGGPAAAVGGGDVPHAPGSARATVDDVRQAAYEQILAHLEVERPSARLALIVRSWVSLAETTALLWLDGRTVARAELEVQLVHDFVALAAVGAAADPELADLVRHLLAQEPPDGLFADLLTRLVTLVPEAPAAPRVPQAPHVTRVSHTPHLPHAPRAPEAPRV
ncbi:TetR/AcrR family transcriptional regulator [Streptomyces buecherae]|uniref:TetR/AcrR family transcriptional regulator n=1 Tax=Streptomyces buecherae TaxID=2763006 RepID=UPI0033E242B6